MIYGEFVDVKPETYLNDNYTRHVGYEDTSIELQKRYFNSTVVENISKKLTQLLQGVDPQNRPIIIPNKTITNIMDSVYQSFRPETGDIYSRYNIASGLNSDDYIQSMINQTIQIIFSEVKTTLEMEENNRKLSVWTTVLGDFNDSGLRSHAPIKILNRHPAYMQFNMNY